MSVVLEHLTKRYAGHPVVNDVSLELAEGEFFVLLGSSGSGKTTILNMVAGLTGLDGGRVLIGGRDVTNLTTQERRVGFVFQNYALFQHMTVGDNIEFGLRVRRMGAAERHKRRDEMLELVGLVGLGRRMPRQLSGGQQQRVALARALAIRPDVLLLDEPLGALDAKIRVELRRGLRAIQRELGIPAILVTHDQDEAFELADRVGVMSFGRLLEVGPPDALYHRPQTEFVATFLGTANLLVGQAAGDGVRLGPVHIALADAASRTAHETRVQVLFRPEEVVLADEPEVLGAPRLGRGQVEQAVFSGAIERLRLRLPPLAGVRPIAPPVAFGDDTILVEASRPHVDAARLPLRPGDAVWVGVRHVHALAHPGLQLLILSDGAPAGQVALALGGELARLAHARAVILGHGLPEAELRQHLQQAKENLGSGLASLEARVAAGPVAAAVAHEVERRPCDLVIAGTTGRDGLETAERLIQAGDHHVLLVPGPVAVPAYALICVAAGEPGKDDVLFAGRLLRHLGARATLLAVLGASADEPALRERAQRFLDNGVRSLEILGVPARTALRGGPVAATIQHELTAGGHDLLVMGMPLADRDGRIALRGIVGEVIAAATCPVLLVRFSLTAAHEPVAPADLVRL